jgi:RNA polymerase sigma-70 factor, ECF subfamily
VSPAAPHDEDEKLVELCRTGDRIAFDRLVLKYQHLVVGMCTRLVNSSQDGEDAAQECFVKVYRGIGKFSGDSSFSTWLYRIAVNTCRNYHRSWWGRLSRQSLKLDAPHRRDEDDDDGPSTELKDTRFVPMKDLERKRLGAAIELALNELPQQQREMVVLRDVQGLSYEEIGRITGQTEGTVKSRLFRARGVLQEKLKGVRS